MAWKKSSAALIEAFDAALPVDPRVERRTMFGYAAGFTGGNMFCGLHEERLVVRLSEEDREALRALKGSYVFEPMPGRPMKEYTVVPPAMHAKVKDLAKWMGKALEYAAALPKKKPAKAKASTKTKAPAKAKAAAKARAKAKAKR
jgi:TfoX/Sxy family transcriptional regulator of competence genes